MKHSLSTLLFSDDSARGMELDIAIYAIVIGLFMLLDPVFLQSPVYGAWKSAGAVTWGVALCSVGFLHGFALWLNGRNKALSRAVRAMACVTHLYIAVEFAIFFVQGGTIWGAITMALLARFLIKIMWPIFDELKIMWGRDNGIV